MDDNEKVKRKMFSSSNLNQNKTFLEKKTKSNLKRKVTLQTPNEIKINGPSIQERIKLFSKYNEASKPNSISKKQQKKPESPKQKINPQIVTEKEKEVNQTNIPEIDENSSFYNQKSELDFNYIEERYNFNRSMTFQGKNRLDDSINSINQLKYGPSVKEKVRLYESKIDLNDSSFLRFNKRDRNLTEMRRTISNEYNQFFDNSFYLEENLFNLDEKEIPDLEKIEENLEINNLNVKLEFPKQISTIEICEDVEPQKPPETNTIEILENKAEIEIKNEPSDQGKVIPVHEKDNDNNQTQQSDEKNLHANENPNLDAEPKVENNNKIEDSLHQEQEQANTKTDELKINEKSESNIQETNTTLSKLEFNSSKNIANDQENLTVKQVNSKETINPEGKKKNSVKELNRKVKEMRKNRSLSEYSWNLNFSKENYQKLKNDLFPNKKVNLSNFVKKYYFSFCYTYIPTFTSHLLRKWLNMD